MSAIALRHRISIREWLARKAVESLRPVYVLLRQERKPWNITVDGLRAMPTGSLGHDLARFLTENGLDLMPRVEWHDVYHVLFGYSIHIHDESCIQFIPLGNGRRSLPYIVSTLVAGVFYPEYWADFHAAYRIGKDAVRFHDWDFEQMLSEPTLELRRTIFGSDCPMPGAR